MPLMPIPNEAYNLLPSHMREGFKLYIETGICTGSFMTAVLCNDLMDAFGKADLVNRRHLYDICFFLYNYAPANSYGSPQAFEAWQKKGGLHGYKPEEKIKDETELGK